MNEQQIFSNMSMLVFNAMNRGVDRDTAMADAEETMRLLIQKSREMANEAIAVESVDGLPEK